jgi:hypothetical protein
VISCFRKIAPDQFNCAAVLYCWNWPAAVNLVLFRWIFIYLGWVCDLSADIHMVQEYLRWRPVWLTYSWCMHDRPTRHYRKKVIRRRLMPKPMTFYRGLWLRPWSRVWSKSGRRLRYAVDVAFSRNLTRRQAIGLDIFFWYFFFSGDLTRRQAVSLGIFVWTRTSYNNSGMKLF